jgi:hypothetical protein
MYDEYPLDEPVYRKHITGSEMVSGRVRNIRFVNVPG